MTEAIYPWPPKELSPNARVHWAVKSREAKKLKNASWAITMQVNPTVSEAVRLQMVFRPPSHRRIDLDNCIARCKAMIDGISLALGIDDSYFHLSVSMGEPIKGGAVMVRFL